MAGIHGTHHGSRALTQPTEYNRPDMTPESVQAPEPGSERMGTFARIVGVFFEPGKTFSDIGRRPAWFVPLLLCCLAMFGYFVAFGQRVGWERYTRQQMASNPRLG